MWLMIFRATFYLLSNEIKLCLKLFAEMLGQLTQTLPSWFYTEHNKNRNDDFDKRHDNGHVVRLIFCHRSDVCVCIRHLLTNRKRLVLLKTFMHTSAIGFMHRFVLSSLYKENIYLQYLVKSRRVKIHYMWTGSIKAKRNSYMRCFAKYRCREILWMCTVLKCYTAHLVYNQESILHHFTMQQCVDPFGKPQVKSWSSPNSSPNPLSQLL